MGEVGPPCSGTSEVDQKRRTGFLQPEWVQTRRKMPSPSRSASQAFTTSSTSARSSSPFRTLYCSGAVTLHLHRSGIMGSCDIDQWPDHCG